MKLKPNIKLAVDSLFIIALVSFASIFQLSCKKLVEINPPVASITTQQVFADSIDAASAIQGIYTTMTTGSDQLTNGFPTIFCGMSADELLPFNTQGDHFPTNTLLKGESQITGAWGNAYTVIYQANASIEGLTASNGIAQAAKNQFLGEAKFCRALYYFYLVNLFGDVPLLTTSNYKINAVAARTPKATVYAQIENDLISAQTLLKKDYSYSNGQRIRATSLAATALLARVYLYESKWSDAETQASIILQNTSTFSLVPDLNQVFSVNNSEAILQWNDDPDFGAYNATQEGVSLIPYDNTSNPNFYLRKELLDAFESLDKRKKAWIDSTTYSGVTYYYPYKYKTGSSEQVVGAAPTELYTVLRLAEQYLIRAEARAQQMNLSGAISDINMIRNRASLPALSPSLNQTDVLAAVYHEWQIEFFAEWGTRWFTLKRTGQADAILGKIKPTWKSYQQLYPIPYSDFVTDPNLTQNPGY